MAAAARSVKTLSLDGAWTLVRPSTGETHDAVVPGCVHLDLQRAGVLASLDWRDNEALQQGLDAETWVYEREFILEETGIAVGELVCEGLDTLATVRINGSVVLEADNMFREWRFSVGAHLRPGRNVISATFHSTLPVIAAGQARRPLREWNIYFDRHCGRGYVRKMACAYGWDWGPVAPTAGIWKSLRLEFTQAARFTDLHIRQQHDGGRVLLNVAWQNEGVGQTRLEVWREGKLVAETSASSADSQAQLKITQPELWWPVDMGAQPLYELRAILRDAATGTEDVWSRRIGLRFLRLRRDADEIGESFAFEINGRPFFCKGANWVPHRIFLPEITRADYARLLQDTADSHMNMLRVWGGGIYESDDFYELCDELGILVWQDFLFACGVYPSWEPAFMENVAAEARDNIRRLRHHPSLALWCGNNELEGAFGGKNDYSWVEYGALFDKLLPGIVAELDPDTAYWPGSPHSPVGNRDECNSDNSGDTHHWSVFFGRQSFESQRNWRCRFMSEYGFQSFPELRTVEAFTEPGDRALMSRIMDYRQRSEVGNQVILSYLIDWFQLPQDFSATLILSQISQSLCVRYAAEHLRRIQPRCQGVLYWQINDIWPCASWSSIDSFGRWKVLQYEARRFFAPVLVSIEEDLAASSARIHVSNQSPDADVLAVRWQITDTDGRVLVEGGAPVSLASQSGGYVSDLDARPLLAHLHPHDLMVWAWVSREGRTLSRAWAPLARPKHLSLARPQLRVEVEGDEIVLSCEKPAAYVSLSLEGEDAIFSDNFFALHPAEPRRIGITRGPGLAAVAKKLRVQSLADWTSERTDALAHKPAGYDLQCKR